MKEGTLGIIILWPNPWPPTSDAILHTLPNQGFILKALATGRLFVAVNADGKNLTFTSQCIKSKGPNKVLVLITWNNESMSVSVSGMELAPAGKPAEQTLHLDLVTPSFSEQRSFDDLGRLIACFESVQWRDEHLANIAIRANRIEKPKEEVLNNLLTEVQVMMSFLNQSTLTPDTFAAKLAGSLRSLLHWEMQSNGKLRPSYMPLLFRVASWKRLPLPVYAWPPTFPTFGVSSWWTSLESPELIKPSPNAEIMDIQQWLDRPVILKLNSDNTVAHQVSAKIVIAETANTDGGAHWDTGIPPDVDELKKMVSPGCSALSSFICRVSLAVANLCGYVLYEHGIKLTEQDNKIEASKV